MQKERHTLPNALTNLSPENKQRLFNYLYEFEITDGCGIRPCWMCSDNAHVYTRSIPFSTIQLVHSLKREYNPRKWFHHYQANDPLYYFDKNGNKTYADVYIDAMENGLAVDTISTHGWCEEEEIPQRAVAELITWSIQSGKKDLITLCIDAYGFVGIDPEKHEAAIRNSANTVLPICKEVLAFYNPNATGIADLSAIQALLKRTLPPELSDKVKYEEIRGVGRAATLNPSPSNTRPFSALGYTIKNNGDLILEPDYEDPLIKISAGNIYTSIETPLQTPYPRAPDFD